MKTKKQAMAFVEEHPYASSEEVIEYIYDDEKNFSIHVCIVFGITVILFGIYLVLEQLLVDY